MPTLTIDAGLHRLTENVTSKTIGNGAATFSSLRYVVNARSTRDAAEALAVGVKGQSSAYGEIASGSKTLYTPNQYPDDFADSEFLCFHRIDFLGIGSVDEYDIADDDENIGLLLASGTLTAEKARRCMVTFKYKLSAKKRSLTFSVT